MIELVKILPEIVWPLFFGTTFVFMFRQMGRKAFLADTKLRWIIGYIFGYVVYTCTQYLKPADLSQTQLVVIYVGVWLGCAILGGVFGKVCISNWLARVLSKFGAGETVEERFWNDLNDTQDAPHVYAVIPSENRAIQGVLKRMASQGRFPQMALSRYIIYQTDLDELVVEFDFREDKTRLCVIDTSKCSHIELQYGSDSLKRQALIDDYTDSKEDKPTKSRATDPFMYFSFYLPRPKKPSRKQGTETTEPTAPSPEEAKKN